MGFSRRLAVVGRRVGEGCGGRGGELVRAGLAECGGHGGELVHAESAWSCFTIAATSQVHAEQHRVVGRKAQRSIAVVILRIDDGAGREELLHDRELAANARERHWAWRLEVGLWGQRSRQSARFL